MMVEMEEELRERWAGVCGRGRDATAALEGLLERHREPHRHYHTLTHVLTVLRSVDELLGQVPVADPDAVRLAAWYHDAVYDPTSPTNEEASAGLARRDLTDLGHDARQVDDVVRLVLATMTHQPAADDEAVLIDADLAVLAADAPAYQAYVDGVRSEYGHVPADEWRVGRAAVLRRFLERPAIFLTPAYAPREARARANLTAELAALDR